ncbi:type II toxin-antitoxin system HipA family toxin [Nesterenkonia sp. MY13]|uniref:Type II toxin-antitoxin system HipA family toxin n=1 Tax=Nesterenkonia sedimenti TaxID=1463632 RepID=A0A7X8YER0_9MICC|nr:type II toxin-antitoxin system HipA family toxin [Nesterenkonia sedimenti]NLS11078.1 type II toxin-antitoxin system HipA family toxin [Nesterenkonia sedimenti]
MIEVFMDQNLAGTAESVTLPTGKRRLIFTYSHQWLADPDSFPISPELPLHSGPQEPFTWRHTPFSFDDAAPDKWGRDLITAERRDAARRHGERLQPLDDLGLLLAVSDETRQGALRFKVNGTFLHTGGETAWVHEVKELREAAARFEASGEIDDSVRHLIGVGSSPGGAAPKAWVRDDDGEMWLAKFPRNSDSGDVSAWELVALRLQAQAGINTMPSHIVRLGPHESVFLTKRFDRVDNRRIPYQSFKTMFMLEEGEREDYATLAQRVASISASPSKDAHELFTRAAFGVMVNNIDDHMRNHGLLWKGNGWRIAPSFDVNPSARGESETPLTPEDDPGDSDLRLLVDHADSFRMTAHQARSELARIASCVEEWAPQARELGIDSDEISSKAKAFAKGNTLT